MKKSSLFTSILIAWLVAGTIDILSAIFILSKGNASGTFKNIAGAVAGKDNSLGETATLLLGACSHYLIALCWTIFYFMVFKKIKFDKLHVVFSALLYGTFIFFAMRYVWVPLLGKLPSPKPIDSSQIWGIVKSILILAVAFGVTLRYFAGKYYSQK
jgi:uncharacterized membrane protein